MWNGEWTTMMGAASRSCLCFLTVPSPTMDSSMAYASPATLEKRRGAVPVLVADGEGKAAEEGKEKADGEEELDVEVEDEDDEDDEEEEDEHREEEEEGQETMGAVGVGRR